MVRRQYMLSVRALGVCAFMVPALSAQYLCAQVFEDVTSEAGVDYVHWIPDPDDPAFCTEPRRMAGGAAAGDFDNDGLVDLYVTRIDLPNLLFRNLGNGSFEEVAAVSGVDLSAASSGCAWGDVNNDGWLDLYVSVLLQRNYLYINNGQGQFTEEAVDRGVAGAPGAPRSTSATFADFDLDGHLDLHIVEWESSAAPDNENLLFHNNGNGFFADVTADAGAMIPGVLGFSSSFADMNADGWPELLVAADFGTSCLFRNLGGSSFQDITQTAGVGTDQNGMGSAVGDYDGDGDLDWFVTAIYDPNATCEGSWDGPIYTPSPCSWSFSGNRLYRNDGDLVFSDQTDSAGVRDGGWGWGASFLDYDNDGDLDLGMANGVVFPCLQADDALFNDDALRLWQNDGSGAMTEIGALADFDDTRSGKGIVVFDYDNDGDLDVYIANNADYPLLLRNRTGNANRWLRVNLRGQTSNRFGLGARIFVEPTTASVGQMREVNARSNFMSHNEVTAHFGLGDTVTKLDEVRVRWPSSGLTQVFRDVAVNRTMLIHEVALADFDTDGDVDNADWAAFETCMLEGIIPVTPFCAHGDMNADAVLDCGDAVAMLQRWTAPDPPAAITTCAAVPTLSHWGVIVLALVILSVGTLILRARPPRTARC